MLAQQVPAFVKCIWVCASSDRDYSCGMRESGWSCNFIPPHTLLVVSESKSVCVCVGGRLPVGCQYWLNIVWEPVSASVYHRSEYLPNEKAPHIHANTFNPPASSESQSTVMCVNGRCSGNALWLLQILRAPCLCLSHEFKYMRKFRICKEVWSCLGASASFLHDIVLSL